MSEEQVNQPQPKPRFNKYLRFVEEIQRNARETELPNGRKVELTYQQALSVYLRSCQLVKEGGVHLGQLGQSELSSQINECYRQYRQSMQNGE